MTIEATASEISYAGNGATLAFAVPFPFDTSADLKVILTDEDGNPEVLTTGFSVGGGGGSTGTVTMAVAPTVDETLTILDNPAQTQPTDYTANDAFPAETHEDALDRVTRLAKRLQQQVNRSLRTADGDPAGVSEMLLGSVETRRNKYLAFDNEGTPEYADLSTSAGAITKSIIAALLYPQTSAETSAGITPSDYSPPVLAWASRYGADPTGVADSTAAIQRAINTGRTVVFDEGTYLANNLTQTVGGQRLIALGNVRIVKNANGPLLTAAGDDIEISGIGFRGDASSPTFTGDGVVITGESPRVVNCGARWFSGRALKATGNHVQVFGTCDIYQTTDATGTGYDIEIGASGTATLYHRILGIRSSQSTGGILFTDCGSQVVEGSQFGKLRVASGTSPAGVNGGNYIGNRILGDSTISISSATFTGNAIGTITLTFGAGTSGHSFDVSNVVASGATITDDSTASQVEDLRQVPPQAYTPTWTGAGGNPVLGNGTLVGLASKRGRVVTVTIQLTIGGTTSFGSGLYFFSLPYIPSTTLSQVGSVHRIDSGSTNVIGACRTLPDGTARMQFYADAATADSPTSPFTWANGDSIVATLTYFV